MKRLIVFFALIFVGCSLRPLDQTQLSISFVGSNSAPLDWTEFVNHGSQYRLLRAPFAPLYQCVGVNVVGYGIPGRGNDNVAERLAGLYQGNACTYQGAFRGMFSTTSGSGSLEVTLDVPTGPSRIVQVGGADVIPATGVCDATGEQEQEIFEWGRAILGVFGPTTVAVNETPNSIYEDPNKKMNCGDGSEPPAQFPGMLFWFKSDDANLCSPGGSPVTSVASSGGDFPALTSSNSSPQCVTNSLNGFPRLDFTVTPQTKLISTLSSASTATEGMTVFLVGKPSGIGPVLYLRNASATATFKVEVQSGPTMLFAVDPDTPPTGSLLVANYDAASFRIYTFVWDKNSNPEMRAQVDASGSVGAPSFFDVASPMDAFAATPPLTLYLFGAETVDTSGSWVEVIGYRRALNAAEQGSVITWLRNKYGFTPPP